MIHPALTARESEVLAHAAAGLTIEETAHRLGSSAGTVRTQRESILRKLDQPSMLAAVRVYTEWRERQRLLDQMSSPRPRRRRRVEPQRESLELMP